MVQSADGGMGAQRPGGVVQDFDADDDRPLVDQPLVLVDQPLVDQAAGRPPIVIVEMLDHP